MGPAHVLELIIPKLEEILSIVNINYVIVDKITEKNKEINLKVEEDIVGI